MAIYSTVSNLFAVLKPGLVIDESIIMSCMLMAPPKSPSQRIVLHMEIGAEPYIIKLHKHVEH